MVRDTRVHPVMEEVRDPDELARAQAQRERADRNAAWLQANAGTVYPRNRGRFICIAGEELCAAKTAQEALALARSVQPDDDGRILRYIPRERVPRIDADLRGLTR